MDEPLHAHVIAGKTTTVAIAAGHQTPNDKDQDEVGPGMPRKEHTGKHHMLMVILTPGVGWSVEGVQHEPHLPEPRTLQQQEEGSGQKCQQAVPELHLQEDREDVGANGVDEQGVDQHIQVGAAVQVELEEQTLHGEGQGICNVVDVRRKRCPKINQNVDYSRQAKEEEHGCMLAVANSNKLTIPETCVNLERKSDSHKEQLHCSLYWKLLQSATKEGAGEGNSRGEPGVPLATQEVASEAVDGVPQGKDDEEGAGQGMTSKVAHGCRSRCPLKGFLKHREASFVNVCLDDCMNRRQSVKGQGWFQ